MNLKLSSITSTKPYTFLADNRDKAISILFILFASITSIVFSFMLPFGQSPDEMAQYQMMESEFGTTGFIDEVDVKVWHGGGYGNLPFNYAAKVDYAAATAASELHFDTPLSITSFHISPLIVRHFPMGLGFYIGVALGLPIIVCTHLAELFATAFFIIVGYLALKITPIKKDIFAFCLLMPETIHQCSSVSYDAVIIPCSFFLFAYILHLYYREKKVGWKDMIIVGIFTLVIAITKVPYAAIVLALLIIPVSHYDLRIGKKDGKNIEVASLVRKFWYIVAILVILAGCAAIYLGRHSAEVKTLVSDVLELPEFLKFLQRTYEQRIYAHLQQMVGMFGWADSFVSGQYVILFFGVMVYLNTCITENVDRKLNIPRRLLMLAIVVIALLMVEVAMQSWNYIVYGWDTTASLDTFRTYIAGSEWNLGVQGRYFIPVLPVMLVALSGITQRKRTAGYYLIQFAFYAASAYSVFNILNSRYWIV